MLVDWTRIFWLSNYFKKVFIRKEEESWEQYPLLLKELVQVPFYFFKSCVQILEDVDEVAGMMLNQSGIALSLLIDPLHFGSEWTVNVLEPSLFFSHQLLDVRLSAENTFQILPHTLNLHQHLKSLCNTCNLLLPEIDSLIKLSVEGRALHSWKISAVLFY